MTTHRRKAATAMGLTLGLVLTACGLTDPFTAADPAESEPRATTSPSRAPTPPPGLDADGVRAWYRWDALDWSDYTYRLTVGCFCPAISDKEVVVKKDDVISIGGKPYDADRSPVGFDGAPPRIEAVFELVADAQVSADEVSVDYDAATGAPTSVNVDWMTDAIDDEMGIRLERLVPAGG